MEQRKLDRFDALAFLLERDGENCGLCKEYMPPEDRQIDHRKPRSKGGTWDSGNLHLVHGRCNSRKGAKVITAQLRLNQPIPLLPNVHSVERTELTCPACDYRWQSRTVSPKRCPNQRCQFPLVKYPKPQKQHRKG